VVVVDGGSTDDTVEVLERLQHRYGKMTIIRQPCSRGRGRDIAYRHARGKYLIQGADGDVIFRPTINSILHYFHTNEKLFYQYALFIPGSLLICTKETMDKAGGWPNLQVREDFYICGKLMQVCTVERNISLCDVAVETDLHARTASTRLFQLPEDYGLRYSYIAWRDYHRYVPFVQVIGSLRQYLRVGERPFLRKLGTVAMFFFGAIGQYTKVRYKARDDVQFQEWAESFIKMQ
jgi:glycosyltransferase involved in cell wall biosynthesis